MNINYHPIPPESKEQAVFFAYVRRKLMLKLFVLVIVVSFLSPTVMMAETLRIAFGSCFEQDTGDPAIWQSISAMTPDLFLFLGDNVYVDSDNPEKFARDYKTLLSNKGVSQLMKQTAIMATWDDHDYGLNDGGKHFSAKTIAKKAFVSAFNYSEINRIPDDQGIYHSRILPLADKTIRVIMLDTRWYRDDLLMHRLSEEDRARFELGPYRPHWDTSKTLLGDQQWAWLEQTLSEQVALNIIVTSIQFIAENTAWEIWANFPHERQRLIELIREHGFGKTVFLSGDVHRGEMSAMQLGDWQLFDLTTGPLNSVSYPGKPNIHRIGGVYSQHNFGMLKIEIEQNSLLVNAGLYNTQGDLLEQHHIPLLQED